MYNSTRSPLQFYCNSLNFRRNSFFPSISILGLRTVRSRLDVSFRQSLYVLDGPPDRVAHTQSSTPGEHGRSMVASFGLCSQINRALTRKYIYSGWDVCQRHPLRLKIDRPCFHSLDVNNARSLSTGELRSQANRPRGRIVSGLLTNTHVLALELLCYPSNKGLSNKLRLI